MFILYRHWRENTLMDMSELILNCPLKLEAAPMLS
jgi:hypothetical protein